MTASTLNRPAPTTPTRPGNGGMAARQAIIRWAWRLFRREWHQQILILLLIIVAVAATILGAAIAANTPPAPNAGFGTADHQVNFPGGTPNLAAETNSMRAHFGQLDIIDNQTLATGLAQPAQLRAQDPAGAYGRPMLTLISGRFPHGAGEVAMTPHLASQLDIHTGDTWLHAGQSLRVVGHRPITRKTCWTTSPLSHPGRSPRPTTSPCCSTPRRRALETFTFPAGTAAVSPQRSDGIAPAVIVFAIAIIGLIFVGLVATAGFTVLAQRRLRALGMLSALGATDRNVRLVMVTNGALVGAIGAIDRSGARARCVDRVRPTRRHQRTPSDQLVHRSHGGSSVASMILAVLTATVASGRPAGNISNIPTVAALSGRPPTATSAHRSAVPGAIILAVSLLMLAFSGGWGGNGGKRHTLPTTRTPRQRHRPTTARTAGHHRARHQRTQDLDIDPHRPT